METSKLIKYPKEAYWQFLRGVAILFVVLSHCYGPKVLEQNKLVVSLSSIWYCLEVNFISTAVAIFFFISGYWAEKSYIREADTYYFCKKRVKRLFIPYILYTSLYVVFRLLLRESFSLNTILEILLLGRACTPLYFLPVLIIYSIFTPVLCKLNQKKLLLILACLIALICWIGAFVSCLHGHQYAWFYLRYTPVWLPFYSWGISMASENRITQSKITNNKDNLIYLIFFMILCYILKITSMLLLISYCQLSQIMFSQLRLTAFAYSASIIIFLNFVRKRIKHYPRIINFIGDYSFGIFFLHMFFIIPLGIMYSHFGWQFPIIFRYIQFIISILGSLIICQIIYRVLDKKLCWIAGI